MTKHSTSVIDLISCAIFLSLLTLGCTEQSPSTSFRSLNPEESGIDFKNELQDSPEQNIIEYLYYYNGGGVGVGDINNDGLLDIYFTSNQGVNRLYINTGGLTFKDATDQYGLTTSTDSTKWSTGVVLVDINGDGYLDIYECVVGNYKTFSGHNKLYINQRGQSFIEESEKYGLDFTGFSTQSAFFDYDHDGDLDMYLLNHSAHSTDSYGEADLRNVPDNYAGDRFYENKLNEGLGFIDVTEETGIFSSRIGYGLGIGVSDLNNDSFLDVYIGNDFHEDDYVYINNGDKTFSEVSKQYLGHTSQFTMGLDLADINSDGLTDVFSLDMLPNDPAVLLRSAGDDNNLLKDIKGEKGYRPQYSRNAMQINQLNHFKEVASFHEVYATDWSWSVLVQDYDNDLDQDIYITNGIYRRPNDLDYISYLSSELLRNNSIDEVIGKMPNDKVENVFFENDGSLIFSNKAKEHGLSSDSFSSGASYADLDNDGDLDIVVNNLFGYATIFENVKGNSSNYLNLSLKDTISNFNNQGIGASVFVHSDSISLKKEISLTRGFQSSISARLHFGLGSLTKVDSIVVVWPDGVKQILNAIPTNQFLSIEKPATSQNVLFTSTGGSSTLEIDTIDFTHQEEDFKEYQIQPLMPWTIGREGPALATNDLNGDGIKDFYIGGAHFQPGHLFISNSNGKFDKIEQPHFKRDAGYEDISACFHDLNRDGFADLLVTSGGNRFPENHPLLEDRIYLNDGKNNYYRLITPMPKINSSEVSILSNGNTDYIFIGSRSIPSNYGLIPNSILMKWNGKSIEKHSYYDIGFVTSAVWTDFDKDDSEELLVAGKWMPIKLYELKNDSLILKDESAFKNSHGFWYNISTGDINGDEVTDYFFANMGLNTQWKPSVEQPVTMYAKDFDDNGQIDPIIFNYYYDEFIPFASKQDLEKQIPAIKKKNTSFQQYSDVRSLTGLIESDINSKLISYENKSRILVSNGEGYQWASLPKEMQYGAIQDAEISVGNMFYVGNDFTFYSSLGRSDSNHSGQLTWKDNKMEWKNLPIIDHKKEYRHIRRLDENRYLIVPNSDSPFIVNFN